MFRIRVVFSFMQDMTYWMWDAFSFRNLDLTTSTGKSSLELRIIFREVQTVSRMISVI